MTTYYWNDWYFAWGWVLWFGMFFLLISSIWNWSYSYSNNKDKSALDLLKQRLARGEIKEEEFKEIKKELLKD